MAPIYMEEILTVSKNTFHNLRSEKHKNIIMPQRIRTNYMKDTFSYYGMTVWNNIPLKIRDANRLKTFKLMYKNHLLKLQDSHHDE